MVCSPFTVALMVGMSVTDVSQKAIANLGWDDIKLTHPLFAGDTLYAESEVLEKRESSRGRMRASSPSAPPATTRTAHGLHVQPHHADRKQGHGRRQGDY